MALPITENLKQGLKASKIKPILILKIEGYDTLFGNVQIKKYIRIGDPDLLIGNDWIIGGFNFISDQNPYVTFNTGTTTKVSQKLDPSRGLGSSVSQMSVSLIDKNAEMLRLISPGFELEEMLGRFCTIYLGIEDSSWPEDYNVIFNGTIQDLEAAATVVTLYLNNTEEKKRAAIFQPQETDTTAKMNYRSVLFQDIFYKNRDDVTNNLTVTYIGGGTAGSEVVTVLGGTTVQVQIQSGVSTASQIRKAVENHPDANQLVEAKIEGNSSNPQVTGSALLVIDLTLDVVDTTNFILPADSGTLRTYLKVQDEVMEYTTKSPTQFAGITRGAFGTPAAYQEDEGAQQILRLKGNPVTLALKLMLSGGPTYYQENVDVKSYKFFSPSLSIDNTIFFEGVDVEKDFGVSAGDLISTENSTNPSNDLTDVLIQEVGVIEDGSYVTLNVSVVTEASSPAIAKFKSQFNTLPIGLEMLPKEVDVRQHIYVRDTYLPTRELDLYFRQITNGKDFLEKELYLPITCFSVPRKGRSSIVIHVGPLPTYEIVPIDLTTVENPEALRVRRSIGENFFNQVRFDYNLFPVDETFASTVVHSSDISEDLIPVGPRPLIIQSKGLRSTSDAENLAQTTADRFLRRYERGAEYIKGIKVSFKVGFQIEIGDVVAVDYASLKLGDFATGDREGNIRLMEVLNKTLDTKTIEVTIDVVNTIFQVADRFGLISPASLTGIGSTTSKLILQKSYGTKAFERESNKWTSYIGQELQVRTQDYSQIYFTFLRGFDNNDPQGMSIDPIAVAPGTDWIIESRPYPNSILTQDMAFWKLRHAYFSPQVLVTAALLSQSTFEVDPADIGKFSAGRTVRVHNYDYTDDSPELIVLSVDTGLNQVTLDGVTGFNIDTTHYVDLIGFPDEQPAYRII